MLPVQPQEPEDDTGYKNDTVRLTSEELLANIRAIQAENNIHQSERLVRDLGCCSLDVEMETGTGKTYVYIKTMFELNKRYGWSKFIVVVPSIAIREGVKKSFDITVDPVSYTHLDVYKRQPYNTGNDFVYEDDFAEDTDSYMARSGQYDEQGNRLTPNPESNGRFHTDWLNMMYPRPVSYTHLDVYKRQT